MHDSPNILKFVFPVSINSHSSRYVVPKPRAECTKGEQLTVTFAAGYIAGVFCAIVSHPADTVVSKLNAYKGVSAMEVAKKLGWAGLWAGLIPRIVMIGKWHQFAVILLVCLKSDLIFFWSVFQMIWILSTKLTIIHDLMHFFALLKLSGTLTAAQWFIYDAVKVTLRMPRPPPAEMPESLKKKMGIQ